MESMEPGQHACTAERGKAEPAEKGLWTHALGPKGRQGEVENSAGQTNVAGREVGAPCRQLALGAAALQRCSSHMCRGRGV